MAKMIKFVVGVRLRINPTVLNVVVAYAKKQTLCAAQKIMGTHLHVLMEKTAAETLVVAEIVVTAKTVATKAAVKEKQIKQVVIVLILAKNVKEVG
jgi:hypothetical protein